MIAPPVSFYLRISLRHKILLLSAKTFWGQSLLISKEQDVTRLMLEKVEAVSTMDFD